MKENRKTIIVLLFLGLGVFFMITGLSYAYFTSSVNSNEQIVESGTLQIAYQNTQNILTSEMNPTTEEYASIHQFTVTNTGTLDATYHISMINIALLKNDSPTTSVNLMWALYEADSDYVEGDLVRKGSFSADSGYQSGKTEYVIATDLSLNVSESQSYVLKVWLQEAGVPQNEDQGLSLNFNIEVSTETKDVTTGIKSILRERDGSTSIENFYAHSATIQKIVIQNQLNPIESAEYSFDVSNDNDKSVMAYLTENTDGATHTLYLQGNTKIYLPEDASDLFRNFPVLTTIEGLEYLDVSECICFEAMFSDNLLLTSLSFDNWDSSKVTTMERMFDECVSLENIIFNQFDTSSVVNMGEMFSHCESLTSLDLSVFNTEQVTHMNRMFYHCNTLINLNTNSFDTSKVTDMREMFYNCDMIPELDLRHFDVSQVTDMTKMFCHCLALVTLNIDGWANSVLVTAANMFEHCWELTSINLENFTFQNVTNLDVMFSNCEMLTSINLRQADFSHLNPTDMFYDVPEGTTVYVKDSVMQEYLLTLFPTGNIVVYSN